MGKSKDVYDKIYETWLGGKDEEPEPEPKSREVHVHIHLDECNQGDEQLG